jgi:hypothetical protein
VRLDLSRKKGKYRELMDCHQTVIDLNPTAYDVDHKSIAKIWRNLTVHVTLCLSGKYLRI